jgi:5-methylcytosine-specific restriction endonuclease McrA
MPIRVCAHPRCPDPAAPGKSMCAVHAAEQRKANRSVNDSWYASKIWRLVRRHQLLEYPFCQHVENGQECGRLADSVHHIQPIEEGGARRDPANLMSVCRGHHSVIHARRQRDASATA